MSTVIHPARQPDPAQHGRPETGPEAAAEPRVEDIMTRRLVAIRSDAELPVAVDAFLRHARRHLLVVDPDRTCRGLVSAERVLAALATAGPGHHTIGFQVPSGAPRVHRAAPVSEAARLMLAELVDALPVVDDDGRVVGVVTWTDILTLVAGHHLGGGPGAGPVLGPEVSGSLRRGRPGR